MQVFKPVTREVQEVEDTLCNKCGESCGKGEYPCGLIEVEARGGYNSPVLDDGHAYKFSLCESCLADLIRSFKLSAFNPARSSCDCEKDPLTSTNVASTTAR